MSEKTDDTRGKDRTPPVGAPRHMAPCEGASEGASPATQDAGEPFDLLGILSLGLGVLALIMLPVAVTPVAVTLVAFSVVSILLGAIRLIDGRFHQRSDAAIAGMVSSLVVLVAMAIMMLLGAITGWDVPVFGCTTPGMSGYGIPEPDAPVCGCPGFDDDEWDGGRLRNECWDGDDAESNDWEADEVVDYLGNGSDDQVRVDGRIDGKLREFIEGVPPVESEDEEDTDSETGPSHPESPKEQDTKDDGDSDTSEDDAIKQVPLADNGKPNMRQVPVSKETGDNMHQA